ncbi:hypothetical protein MTR67_048550, partial [Solanum verrucosum]
TRRQILLKSADPTINQVYAMIIEDKGERSMSVHNVTDGNGGCEPLAMQDSNARGPPHYKPPLVCDNCHMKGHTKSVPCREWIVDSGTTHHISSSLSLLEQGPMNGIGREEDGFYVLKVAPAPSEQSDAHVLVPNDSRAGTADASTCTAPAYTRKSTRRAQEPVWLKDYVTTKKANLYSLSNYLIYDATSPKNKAYLANFSTLVEPKCFNEAVQDTRWVEAMNLEVQALEDNKTWKGMSLLHGKNAIGSKWVYKIKYKANGEVERFKAQLVTKGYCQREGLDYHDTFSSVAKMVTVRSVIALAALKNWILFQMDVYNDFLQGDVYEEVYMDMPEGFRKKGRVICGE